MMLSVEGCSPESSSSRSWKPGGRAGDGVAALERLLQLVHRQRQQIAERPGGVGDAVLGDLEHLRLGFVERLGDVVGLEVGDLGDVAGDADQLRSSAVSCTILA